MQIAIVLSLEMWCCGGTQCRGVTCITMATKLAYFFSSWKGFTWLCQPAPVWHQLTRMYHSLCQPACVWHQLPECFIMPAGSCLDKSYIFTVDSSFYSEEFNMVKLLVNEIFLCGRTLAVNGRGRKLKFMVIRRTNSTKVSLLATGRCVITRYNLHKSHRLFLTV